MANTCIGEDFSEELTCAVCLDAWKDPVELRSCGHIFCRACIRGVTECPVCRKTVEAVVKPNRTLVNLALLVHVKCLRCGWTGTREASLQHQCPPGAANGTAHHSLTPTPAPHNTNNNNISTTTTSSNNTPRPGNETQNNVRRPQTFATAYPPVPSYSTGAGAYQPPAAAQPLPYAPPYPTAQTSTATMTATSTSPYMGVNYPPNYFPAGTGLMPGQATQTSSVTYYSPPPQPPAAQPMHYETIEPAGEAPWLLYNMNQREYDHIVSLYYYFDRDDNGSLDKAEMTQLFTWLNFAQDQARIDQLFSEMDVRHRNRVSLGELLTWLKYKTPNTQALYGLKWEQYMTIMMQFHVYDKTNKGSLNMDEFTELVMGIGDVRSIESAHRLFRLIDTAHAGKVNLNQFLLYRAGKR